MRLIKSTPKGKQRVYDIEVADVHNFYANGINVHNCATDGGVSVIKDDGTVVDMTGFTPTRKIQIDKNYVISTARAVGNDFIFKAPIPSTDSQYDSGFSNTYGGGFYANSGWTTTKPKLRNDDTSGLVFTPDDTIIMGGSSGVELIGKEITVSVTESESPIAYISSSYNTGWMHGDIKLATLSDTDTTNVTGSELVTNGTFDSNTNGWTIGVYTEGAISVDNGKLKILNVTDRGRAFQSGIPVTAGKHYVLQFDAITGSTTGFTHVSGGTATANNIPQYVPFYFYATGSTIDLQFGVGTATNGDYVYYDNISIREVDPDRSVNNKGLQVFGTITKQPVAGAGATAAELVAYSGFSGSNVLVQPYNSSLDPGTGDYSFVCWFKCSPVSGEQMIMRRFSNVSVTGGMMMRVVASSSALQWYVRDTSSNANTVQSPSAVDDGNWHCAVGTRQGSTAQLYLDGVLVTTQTCSANSHDPGTTANLVIGAEEVTGSPGTYQNPADLCSLTLVRYSLSAPTPEQIKKIYEDEKVLFQENAKCTLYGASDAVTALAYDDDNQLLHVGTSSGRSDFQGLRRINNTTTAVTTAISASNGLIAEQ